jgi:hypothetical protein
MKHTNNNYIITTQLHNAIRKVLQATVLPHFP